MFTIQQSVTIARPVDQVFAFLADPANIPRWRPDVLETRGGSPLHVGSEFDELISFGGRKTQTFRVEVFEANKTLEVAAIADLGIRPTQCYLVASSDAGTTLFIGVTVRTQGLFRLLEPMLPRMIATKWRDYSERLRELLESRPVVTPKQAQAADGPRGGMPAQTQFG
jgi:uncharacterized protein YndB with AHSA1/START domain